MVSEKHKEATARWDKANMTTMSIRVTKARAQEFKDACKRLETVPNRVFLEAIRATVDRAKEKSGE